MPGLLTVCVASLSCGNLSAAYYHISLHNGFADELVSINIWYKLESKVQKAPLAIAGGGSVEGQKDRNKGPILRSASTQRVWLTDSK